MQFAKQSTHTRGSVYLLPYVYKLFIRYPVGLLTTLK